MSSSEGVFCAGSLILILIAFLPTTFLAFQDGVGVVVALLLLVRIKGGPTLASPVEVSAESTLGAQAETGTARIGDSFPKLGM
jgi:hypothetical protein